MQMFLNKRTIKLIANGETCGCSSSDFSSRKSGSKKYLNDRKKPYLQYSPINRSTLLFQPRNICHIM